MARDLRGKVIIITGASSGIGAATAIACAKAGMDVVLNARRADRLVDVAEDIRLFGRRAHVVASDVVEPGISARMLDEAQRVFGRCDAVFANAGYTYNKPLVKVSNQELRHIFEVNFFAAWDLLKHTATRWISAGQSGHLLMCSSCLAKFTIPMIAPYTATKAAQNHFCRALRIELAAHNIEVASVHPITTTTELFAVSHKLSGTAGPPEELPAHAPKLFVQPPSRVANAVVRCLRHPKPEVWTSFTVRFAAGLVTIFPRLQDIIMRRTLAADGKNH